MQTPEAESLSIITKPLFEAVLRIRVETANVAQAWTQMLHICFLSLLCFLLITDVLENSFLNSLTSLCVTDHLKPGPDSLAFL